MMGLTGKMLVLLATTFLVLVASVAYATRPVTRAPARIVTTASRRTAPPLRLRAASYLGVTESGAMKSYRPIETFSRAVGKNPDIVLYYLAWGDPFTSRLALAIRAHKAIPFIQINPGKVPMASIADGRFDDYLTAFADQARAYGWHVLLSFAAEMNGDWDPWGWRRTRPALWVAAWRHVVTLFRRQHAANVTWIWTINRVGPATGPLRDWWPGSRYVGWVGIDCYYFTRSDTFASVIGRTVTAVRHVTRRPILVSEVAIGQVAGQAREIPGLFAGIKRDRLLGLVWFDTAQHGSLYHQDWRLEGHRAAIAAFRRGLRLIGYR